MRPANQKLVQDAQQFLHLYQRLSDLKLRNMDIAKALDLHASSFSTLINKVFRPLTQINSQSKGADAAIQSLFAAVNNLSEVRVRRKLEGYLQRMAELEEEVRFNGDADDAPVYVNQLIVDTPHEILRMLEGVYECYYLSSFGYQLKKEPLRIKYNEQSRRYLVQKGNELSHAAYQGFIYLSNHQLLTMQMQEMNTLTPDHFIAHFQLPPSYATVLRMLKGITISMSNAYLPISRKVILNRIANSLSYDAYNTIETVFYGEGQGQDNPVINYLRADTNYMEYLPIPYPTYSAEDLEKEERIRTIQ